MILLPFFHKYTQKVLTLHCILTCISSTVFGIRIQHPKTNLEIKTFYTITYINLLLEKAQNSSLASQVSDFTRKTLIFPPFSSKVLAKIWTLQFVCQKYYFGILFVKKLTFLLTLTSDDRFVISTPENIEKDILGNLLLEKAQYFIFSCHFGNMAAKSECCHEHSEAFSDTVLSHVKTHGT